MTRRHTHQLSPSLKTAWSTAFVLLPFLLYYGTKSAGFRYSISYTLLFVWLISTMTFGLAIYSIWQNKDTQHKHLLIATAGLVAALNTIFLAVFNGLGLLVGALILTCLVWFIGLILLVRFYKTHKISGYLVIPLLGLYSYFFIQVWSLYLSA